MRCIVEAHLPLCSPPWAGTCWESALRGAQGKHTLTGMTQIIPLPPTPEDFGGFSVGLPFPSGFSIPKLYFRLKI